MPPSIPTKSALSAHQLIPSTHPAVIKTLQRLSRPALLSLVLDWLDPRNQELTAPALAPEDEEDQPDDDDDYPAARNLGELQELYEELQSRKGSKRDVVDRILEGDWRNGITLYQLAMVDMQYLYDHPTSQKWTALKIVRVDAENAKLEKSPIPRFHPATFLQNMKRESLPDVKAHYNLDRHKTLPLWILRIFIIDSPYNTSLALQPTFSKKPLSFDTSKIFYVAFPDVSPYIYVSLTTAAPAISASAIESKSLRKLVLEDIPKAFSKPKERYKLESTSLSTRNLEALCVQRGGGRANAANGAWGLYATENKKDTPLNIIAEPLLPPQAEEESEDELSKPTVPKTMKRKLTTDTAVTKRRKLVARGRFGNSAALDDGKGIERLDIRLDEPYPSSNAAPPEQEDEVPAPKKRKGRRSTLSLELDRTIEDGDEGVWRPDVRLTFHGSHIFAGMRKLVEAGIVDGERIPGWMTGEDGVSVGIVRDGRIAGGKGNGL